MNESLYRLVYISSNEIKGDDATIRQEIEQILAAARSKNRLENITGVLMFNDGCFAQVLEGAHDDIQDTFERIQCDQRHSNVSVLAFEPALERGFSNWSMAYIGVNTLATDKFRDITQTTGFDPVKLESEHILSLLNQHVLEAEVAS